MGIFLPIANYPQFILNPHQGVGQKLRQKTWKYPRSLDLSTGVMEFDEGDAWPLQLFDLLSLSSEHPLYIASEEVQCS